MSNSSSSNSSGIGFLGLLALIFITLKLLGEITWSWWWVLSPLWIPAATIIVVAALVFGGSFAIAIISALIEKFRR